MTTQTMADTRPPVRLNEADFELLQHLVDHASPRIPGVTLLADELDRAQVAGAAPDDVVRLGSLVQYQDLSHNEPRWVQLVLPEAAAIEAGRISVLTPIGAALIGLRAGDTFEWARKNGESQALRVLAVRQA